MDINKLQYIKEIIRNADQVLIGIGEDWNLFEKRKAESEAESDYLSVLSLEESSQKKESVMDAYESLYELVKDKPHFVVTMNADDVIYQTGFAEEQIVTPCGSVHMLQCRQHILERFETAPLFDRMKDNMRNTGRLWAMQCSRARMDFSRPTSKCMIAPGNTVSPRRATAGMIWLSL